MWLLEMMAQLNRQLPSNINRERRAPYQHPKGAPDADVIFGSKYVVVSKRSMVCFLEMPEILGKWEYEKGRETVREMAYFRLWT